MEGRNRDSETYTRGGAAAAENANGMPASQLNF